MKKAILISGIVTIVSYATVMLIFLIVGFVNIAAKGMAETGPGAVEAEELAIVGAVFLGLAGGLLLAVIFAGIMIGKRFSGMGKGAGITLGVFGVLSGAVVPGIIFIVDSAKTRG